MEVAKWRPPAVVLVLVVAVAWVVGVACDERGEVCSQEEGEQEGKHQPGVADRGEWCGGRNAITLIDASFSIARDCETTCRAGQEAGGAPGCDKAHSGLSETLPVASAMNWHIGCRSRRA